jgi:hypothetical protein
MIWTCHCSSHEAVNQSKKEMVETRQVNKNEKRKTKKQKAALLSSEEWERIAVRNNLDGKQNMHTVPKRVDPLENQGRTKM